MRWFGRGLLAVLAAVALGVAFLAVVLPREATRAWVRPHLAALLQEALQEPVEIAAVRALSPSGLTLAGVSIGGGEPIVRAGSVDVQIALGRLLPPRLTIEARLTDVELFVERQTDGTWNIERLAGDGEGGEVALPGWIAGVRFSMQGGRVRLEGLAPRVLRVVDVELEGALDLGRRRRPTVAIEALSATVGEASQVDLDATVSLDGEPRVQARLAFEPLVAADLAGLLATATAEAQVRGEVRVEGRVTRPRIGLDLATGDGRLAATAEVDAQDAATRIDLTFESRALDLRPWWTEAPVSSLDARGELGIGLAAGTLERVDGRIELDEGRFFDIEMGAAEVLAETEDGAVALRLTAATTDESVRVSATGRFGLLAPPPIRAEGLVRLRTPAGTTGVFGGHLAGSDLEARLALEVADPGADAPTAGLTVGIGRGRLRGLPIDGADLRAELTPEILRLERFWVGADRTNLEAEGWMQLVGDPAERAVGGTLRGPLSLPLFVDAYGVVQTDLTFWGTMEDLGLAATLASVGSIEAPGVDGTFSARIDGAHIGGSQGAAVLALDAALQGEGAVARVFGREERPAVLRARWSRAVPASGANEAAVRDRIEVDASVGAGGAGLDLAAVVESAEAQTRLSVSQLEVRPVVGPAWTVDAPASIRLGADRIDVDAARVVVGPGALEARGRLASGAGVRNDFEIGAESVDLGALCGLWLVGESCQGQLEARLAVAGAPQRPEIDFELEVDDFAAAGQAYGRLRATATARGETLGLQARLGGPDAYADLEGRLPIEVGRRTPVLSLTRPASITVRAADLPMAGFRGLLGGSVRRLDGRASARIDVRGGLADPVFEGDVSVQDLLVSVAATGATHRDGRVRLAVDSQSLLLRELTLDGGAITGGGDVGLSGGFPSRFALWLALDEARVVHRAEADVRVSGRLSLAGPAASPRLAGRIDVDRATLRPTVAPGSGAPEADPTIRVVRRFDEEAAWVSGVPPEFGGERQDRGIRPRGPVLAPSDGSRPLFEDASVAVTVGLGDAGFVRRFDANLRLDGEVYVNRDPEEEIRISGGIGGRQGWYIFQGRRFEIQRARVTFAGKTPPDPDLDVEAQYRAREYTVRIRITGTTQHPSLNLSSDPPLDQSDILAVILFGKPVSQLDDSQGQILQSQALALLASYVAPELQRSVLDTFGLASLTFSMPTGDTAGTIGVGRYFGDDLFVSVARDFGGPSGGSTRQLQGLVGSSVTIQYSLTPDVTLQGASSTEGESSVDVIWRRRY